MTEVPEEYDWTGRTLVGADGEKIGKVDEFYVDHDSSKPEWARVTTGLLGTNSSFAPLAGAAPRGEEIGVSVTKDQVKAAPSVDPGNELSEDDERQLFRHYGVDYTEQGSVTATGEPTPDAEANGNRGAVGGDTSGPTTDDAMSNAAPPTRWKPLS